MQMMHFIDRKLIKIDACLYENIVYKKSVHYKHSTIQTYVFIQNLNTILCCYLLYKAPIFELQYNN